MLLFGLVFIVVVFFAVPAVASVWSIYGLIKWRGIWRLLAIPPLIGALVGFAYYVGVAFLGFAGSTTLSNGLFDVDLAIVPYIFFVVLFRRDAQKSRVVDGVS